MFIPDPDPDISFFKKPNTDSIKIPGSATLHLTIAIKYLNTKYLKSGSLLYGTYKGAIVHWFQPGLAEGLVRSCSR